VAKNPLSTTRSSQGERRCEAYTDRGRCRNNKTPGMRFCHAHIRQFTFDECYDPVMNARARNALKRWEKDRRIWERKHPDNYYPVPLPASSLLMVCGAKTRRGTPCRRRDLYRSGRCPLHGGLSTGPKTTAGKERSAKNGFRTNSI